MIVMPSGISVISSLMTVTSGCSLTLRVIVSEKESRSTAKAPPAGTAVSSAEVITTEFNRRISSFNKPTAFAKLFPLKELEQTNSAKLLVWCASVDFTGRISYKRTGTPA